MHFVDARRSATERYGEERQPTPLHPGSAALRRACRRNIVSFPSQVPVFLQQPTGDVQWRMVLLYFVRGWSGPKIAARFNVPIHRIRKILNAWSLRALELGYIQVIDTEAFAACCRDDADTEPDRDIEEIPAHVGSELAQRYSGQSASAGEPFRATIDEVHPDDEPVESQRRGGDLVAALDTAVAECEGLPGEFWAHTATLLRNVRTAAAVALAIRLSADPVDGPFGAPRSGQVRVPITLLTRDEEGVSRVV